MQIGIMGLGLLGYNIGLRLLNCNFKVNVYNRTSSKSSALAGSGATVLDSPKKIGDQSTIVAICVTNYAAINDLCFKENSLINSNNKNLIVLDFSTITPKESEISNNKFKENGIAYLNTPVMGGPAAALEGKLIPIVSGEKFVYEKISSVISKLGNPIYYVGDKPGSANAIKLALNLNIGIIAVALSEGLILSESFGLDPSLYLRILNSTYFKTGMSENKGPRMIKGDYNPSFYLKHMKKDLSLVMDMAGDNDIALPITNSVLHLFNYASKMGLENLDYTAIYTLVKKLNGMK
ncbi:MAG TPA: NAD(P)-dependent oxidoreductase [Nitrososphaeraceae archaeon]|nr:NAD(P)-dependent oxidoreductase [Nitrososphaeraceae archaeon]